MKFDKLYEEIMSDSDSDGKDLKIAQLKFKKELKAIHKEISIVGRKTPEGRELMKKEYKLKLDFKNKFSEEDLARALTGKASSFGKLQKSKGYGYGG